MNFLGDEFVLKPLNFADDVVRGSKDNKMRVPGQNQGRNVISQK